jgi:Phage Terminase
VKQPTPRWATPPLRRLTRHTSGGHEVIQFASELGVDLMPWQRWALIHGLEKLPGGRPRFRVVLILVGRQNGKTTILQVLALHRMVTGLAKMVLGTSTNMEYAREAWNVSVELAMEKLPHLIPGPRGIKRGALDTSLTFTNGARYKIASANRRGGRSLAVDLGIADEIREHGDWEAWAAMEGATTARRNSQIWCLSNAGDDRSVVLNFLQESAQATIKTGEGEQTLGLFEWSAPEDCEIDDESKWPMANPALGYTIDLETLRSKLNTTPPAVFRTEHLCQRVQSLDEAIDNSAWRDLADLSASLEGLRDRVALCVDVALDLRHITLAAAAVDNSDRVQVEIVDAWESVDQARMALPALLEQIKPRVLGWFPGGPGATLASYAKPLKKTVEIKSHDVTAVCQGFAEQVLARRILHQGDPLLSAQVSGASKLYVGDGWRFTRKGPGHVDALYAAAGATHLARTLPPPSPRPLVLVGRRSVA